MAGLDLTAAPRDPGESAGGDTRLPDVMGMTPGDVAELKERAVSDVGSLAAAWGTAASAHIL